MTLLHHLCRKLWVVVLVGKLLVSEASIQGHCSRYKQYQAECDQFRLRIWVPAAHNRCVCVPFSFTTKLAGFQVEQVEKPTRSYSCFSLRVFLGFPHPYTLFYLITCGDNSSSHACTSAARARGVSSETCSGLGIVVERN
ncbi:hypothetical protein EV426DRAFT_116123 [Tirmania nivea]|nr:hypothetical protein EV426DRAFT_116123 [Tirmania nivea]